MILLRIVFLLVLCSAFSMARAWTFLADFEGGTVGQQCSTSTGGIGCFSRTTTSDARSVNGTKSARVEFLQGSDAWGQSGGGVSYPSFVQNGGEIWARGYFYFATPWSWSVSPVAKLFRIHIADSGGGNVGYLSALFDSSGRIVGSNEISPWQPTTSTYYDLNQWQYIEIYVKLSPTPGQGIFRIWKNGVLALEDLTRKTLNSSTDRADFTYVFTYWNGGVPQNQFAWIDSFKITTDRPSNTDAAGNYMIGAVSDDVSAPTIPTGLIATAQSESQINLSWNSSTDNVGISGYDIRRCSGSGCIPSVIVHSISGTGTTWNNTGLSANTVYRYDVRAKDFVPNYSGYSSISQATTQVSGDSTPPSVSITTNDPSNISTNSLVVTGSASDGVGVSGCKWRLSSAPNINTGTVCTGTTSFSCNTSGYAEGANTLHVGCYDAAGNYGLDSIAVNFTPTPPTVVSRAISTSGNTFLMGFDSSVNVSGSLPTLTGCSGGTTTLSLVSGSGTPSLVFGISRIVLSGEIGCVSSYSQPGNGIESLEGGDLASFSNQGVTNNSTAVSDSDPPVISWEYPIGDLSSLTTSVSLQLLTNENAFCKYGMQGQLFSEMMDFNVTGGLSHIQVIPVQYGGVYNYCAICRDAALNTSEETCTRFSIPAAPKRPVLG